MLTLNYPLKLLRLYLAVHMNVSDQHICITEFIFNPKLHPSRYNTMSEIIRFYMHTCQMLSETCLTDLGLLPSTRISEI